MTERGLSETATQRQLFEHVIRPHFERLTTTAEEILLQSPHFVREAAHAFLKGKDQITFNAGPKEYLVSYFPPPKDRVTSMVIEQLSISQRVGGDRWEGLNLYVYASSVDVDSQLRISIDGTTNIPETLVKAEEFLEKLRRDIAASDPKATPEE